MLTKIADLKDQWDDFKKLEAVAAVDSIQKTFEALVLEKSTEWAAKIAEKEEAAKAAVAKQEEVAKRAESLSQAVAELTKKLEDIELAEKQKTAEANFNARMGALDETFDLDDEDRSFLVEEVRSLDTEAAFAAWFDKKKKLMKEKTKAYKSNKAKCMKEEMAKAGVTVVIDEKTLDMTEVVASLKQDKQELPPVSTEPARDLKASMQKAFAEGIEIRKL
jgi:electron transfer flavoprotein alpha subunit